MFTDFADAAVVSRGKPSATKNAARASAASTVTVSAPAPVAEVTPQPVATEPTQPEIMLENKSNMFSDAFGTSDSDDDDDDDSRDMLARIAAFRAKQNVSDTTTKSGTQKSNTAPGTNKCDQDLRKCMAQKCGNDFQKCAGDTDTIWGTKMDECRRSTTCTGHEYAMFTPEIKADRDIMQQLSLYESIMNCGNSYNDCIVGACGRNFEKCIKKSDAEAATKQCQQIAKDCQEQDSGLSARATEAMTSARNISEYTIAHDEKRLYALRDKMREACGTLNAAFDERTFSCVYTVNFRAGEDDSIFASKKAYVGSTFNCDQNWFGVDVTTFMENAFRLTRSQKGASAAMLGSGLGTGVGAITSGAIDRAVDRAKAERAYNQELCEQTKGTWNKTTKLCKCPKTQKYDKETGCTNDVKKWLKNNNCTDDSTDEDCESILSEIKKDTQYKDFSWQDLDKEDFDNGAFKEVLKGIFNK